MLFDIPIFQMNNSSFLIPIPCFICIVSTTYKHHLQPSSTTQYSVSHKSKLDINYLLSKYSFTTLACSYPNVTQSGNATPLL
mmetsp:Transcript_16270/g.34352  ORF Transcript_16270/g.34352 Transcript_16270/m.34352 type:complete len:82 (-) Transcript_16270:306-551(-)